MKRKGHAHRNRPAMRFMTGKDKVEEGQTSGGSEVGVWTPWP